MRLGFIISDYRYRHGLSLGEFAKIAGVSKSYISMLEKGVNSRGCASEASVEILRKLSSAMGMTFEQLMARMEDKPINEDDIPFNLQLMFGGVGRENGNSFSPEVLEVANKYECLTSENRKAAERMINALYEMQNKEGQK